MKNLDTVPRTYKAGLISPKIRPQVSSDIQPTSDPSSLVTPLRCEQLWAQRWGHQYLVEGL